MHESRATYKNVLNIVLQPYTTYSVQMTSRGDAADGRD